MEKLATIFLLSLLMIAGSGCVHKQPVRLPDRLDGEFVKIMNEHGAVTLKPKTGEVVLPTVLRAVAPEYPHEVKDRQSVSVQVLAFVDVNGEVLDTVVRSSSDDRFNPNAITAVKKYKFRSGTFRGEPVVMNAEVTVVFH
jgi:hypothetical protein